MNIHPCSREFQAEAKRLGLTGNQLIQKYQNDGIIKSHIKVDREVRDKFAIKRGYKDFSDYNTSNYYLNLDKYKNLYDKHSQEFHPKNGCSNNLDSSLGFGVTIGERLFYTLLKTLFEDVQWLPFDGINRNKINFKVSKPRIKKITNVTSERSELGALVEDRRSRASTIALICRTLHNNRWNFNIEYNYHPDLFILSGWDNRKNLNILNTWIFHSTDILRRGNNNNIKSEFWNRNRFVINNNYNTKYSKYELDKSFHEELIKLWEEMRDEI